MAQYKRSREDNYEDENPPKRSSSRSNSSLCDADVLVLLADLLFADDDDINAQDLGTAQNALVLDMMTSLDQEINSCHKKNSSSVSVATEGYSIYNNNSGDNPSSSGIVGQSPNTSCKMIDESYSVNIDYLLRATDEELGIPSTSLSDLKKTDHESTSNSYYSDNVWDGFMLESSSAEAGMYMEFLGM